MQAFFLLKFSKEVLFVGFINKSNKKVAKMNRSSNIPKKGKTNFYCNIIYNQIFLEILLTDTFMLIVVSLLYSDLSSLNIKLVEMEASARISRCVLLIHMRVENELKRKSNKWKLLR